MSGGGINHIQAEEMEMQMMIRELEQQTTKLKGGMSCFFCSLSSSMH
jgi:hypothetical protein